MRAWLVLAWVTACGFSSPIGSDAAVAGSDALPIDTPVARACGPDYNDATFNGHSYRMITQGMPWAAAQANCDADGGHLLKIETAAENQRAEELLVGFYHVWIGLHDVQANDTYRWADDTAPAFTNWGNVDGQLDCVGLNAENGRWNTLDCASTEWAVCECDGLP